MPAPSLVDSCTKSCIKNIRSLNDVGDFEYWTIRTVLLRVDSAEQLHQIETNSPQIKGEDAELWRALIARDIPNWREKNYSPKNPLKWYEVYCKYKREQQKEIAHSEEILRNTLLGIKREKETHVIKVVDLRTLPKVPRDPRMLANNGGVPIGRNKGFAKQAPSTLTWTAGSKTKLTDGKSVLTRARREAKEISQRSKLSKPAHELQGRIGQVKRAPAGMVNEYRKAAEPPLRILSRKKTSSISGIQGGISGPSLEERERKLRALTMTAGSMRDSSGTIKETLVGSSEDDDSGNENNDVADLFGESSKPQTRPSISRRPAPGHAATSSSMTARARQQPPLSSSSNSSPPLNQHSKPSDLISSIISKSKPSPHSQHNTSNTSPPPRPSSSISSISRISGPAPGTPRPMMPRKRPEVDIFNRGSNKRPRAR